jgi:hypothetical protein
LAAEGHGSFTGTMLTANDSTVKNQTLSLDLHQTGLMVLSFIVDSEFGNNIQPVKTDESSVNLQKAAKKVERALNLQ